MKRLAILSTLCAALAAPSAGFALTTELNFSGSICGVNGDAACGNFAQFGQTYGDIAGVLDVSYRSINTTSGLTDEPFLKYWNSGYASLVDVAFGGLGESGYRAEITFTPGAGQLVTLNSLDFASFTSSARVSSMLILDAARNATLFSSGSFGVSNAVLNFAPAVSSTSGLILQWGPDAYNVGVDNIALSITAAVPEPGIWAMMAAGLGLLGAVARRRRRC